jgi:tryptophan-rich sensory protein
MSHKKRIIVHNKFKEFLKIIICIIICLSIGTIGALFTVTGPDSWYSNLTKPSFNPPNWIFGPVWTTLYILMGISLYLIIKNKIDYGEIKIFSIQLLLNLLWSVLFFGLENTLFAAIEIIILLAAIMWTIKIFYKKSKVAAYILIPYALWVSFATILTWMIYLLN